jgi:hypothetical protein
MNLKLLFVGLVLPFYCSIARAQTCDAQKPENFHQFFVKFSESKRFAVSRSLFPLKVVQWEYGVDENGKEESSTKISYTEKIVFQTTPPLSAYMREHGLESKIKSTKSNSSIVEVFKPETCWVETWHFVRKGNCWYFHEHQDHSL